MLFFSTKNNEVIVDRPFQNSGVSVHQALVAFSARHSSRTEHRNRILSYSFDIQSCLHKYKRLACRIYGNALEKFAVKFAKKTKLYYDIKDS